MGRPVDGGVRLRLLGNVSEGWPSPRSCGFETKGRKQEERNVGSLGDEGEMGDL